MPNEQNKRDKKNETGNNYRFEIWLRTPDRGRADEIRSLVLSCINTGNTGQQWVARELVHKTH